MDYFNYRHGELYAEDVPVQNLVKRWGTPCYVYSRATLERHYHVFQQSFAGHPHRVCYAVKANSNLAVLNVLARLGSGFDIVSIGELERVLAAGGDASKTVFSGVGKLRNELRQALQANVACFNVESLQELVRLNQIAGELGRKAPISLRVNPDIDARTHPYIATGLKDNKFGIDINEALAAYQQAKQLPNIEIMGVAFHIGSQLTDLQPFLEAFDRALLLIEELRKHEIRIKHLDIGGGLGVRYFEEQPPEPIQHASALLTQLTDKNLEIILEPGRAIVGNAGILVTKIEYLKLTSHKHFAIVDAAMNDFIRPALYNAWQEIIPVVPRPLDQQQTYDVVGPVCETGDFLAKDRRLAVQENDLLAIRTVGAYGFVMSSNYNSRPRIAEIMVDKDKAYLVRRRETINELFAHETVLPT